MSKIKRYIARVTIVIPKDEPDHPEVDQFIHAGTNHFPISEENIDQLDEMNFWLKSIFRRVRGEWGAFIEVYPDAPSLERFGKMFAIESDTPDYSEVAAKVATAVYLIEGHLYSIQSKKKARVDANKELNYQGGK